MSLTSIIGQPLALELCRRWLAKDTTHPLLFYGPEGIGKRTTALQLAKALNCGDKRPLFPPNAAGRRKPITPVLIEPGERSSEPGDACDLCNACRKIAAGNHPDVRVIDLAWQAAERHEPIEKQQNLRIETVLTERRRLLQSPLEGDWKVMILDDAHRLTPDAANVLLKVLEEPPPHTALVLVTPHRDRLFSTVQSRCQPMRFRPLTTEEMREALGKLGVPENAQLRLLELALGSPGRALRMNRQEQIEEALAAEALWQALPQQRPSQLLTRSEGRSRAARPGRGDIEEKVRCLLVPAARGLRAGDPKAARSVGLIQSALQQLRQNVQPALVYEYLLIQLAQQRKP
jgi:DNA polymerase III subunit delta'